MPSKNGEDEGVWEDVCNAWLQEIPCKVYSSE